MLRGTGIFFAFVALLAVATEVYLHLQHRAYWRRTELAAERDLLGGGLQGLLRARTMAMAGATSADNADPAATIALSSAMLVSEYGLGEEGTARAAANTVESAPKPSQRAQSLKLASRALLELAGGRLDKAEALARESVALGHKQASPLFVLGRVRLRQGNLSAASHALQAALVREPSFIEARVAWAEVWLEQGERERARENLLLALQHTPDHGRAQLMLSELEAVDARATAATWETTCARDEAKSAFIASACDLARAQRAARADDRAAAVRWAEEAGRRRPAEPRMLGGAAQLLASLGAVDRASSCLTEATRIASLSLPSLRWATAAVDLGRGYLADLVSLPKAASSPRANVMIARNALASGGIKALSSALKDLPGTPGERQALALEFRAATDPLAAEVAPNDPFHRYLRGMRARLAGNSRAAIALLAGALREHGDACRAAGEYLAACREIGQAPDDHAVDWLRRENLGCVNLPLAKPSAQKPRGEKGPEDRSH